MWEMIKASTCKYTKMTCKHSLFYMYVKQEYLTPTCIIPRDEYAVLKLSIMCDTHIHTLTCNTLYGLIFVDTCLYNKRKKLNNLLSKDKT